MGENTEPKKADLEIAHLKVELDIKEVELEIKRSELKSKSEEKTKRMSVSSPLTLAIITGIFGLIGAGVANIFQTRSNLQLERQKLESSLILKAIETDKPESSAKNLLWLLNAKLISDPSGSIARLKDNPQDAPALNASVPVTAAARQVFFNRYTAEFGTPDRRHVDVLTELFRFIQEEKEINDVRHVAYILATIKAETGDTWQPLTEVGSDSILKLRYGPDTPRGKQFGHTQPSDAVRYKGRGYIMIVGKNNYQKMNEALGLTGTDNDLVKYPDKALDQLIAYRIASYVMQTGFISKKKLGDFINNNETDYLNARKVVNSVTDRSAEDIATNAKKFEAILRDSLAMNKGN